jgi:hypothetical protein
MDVSMSASEKKLCSMELDNVLKELNSWQLCYKSIAGQDCLQTWHAQK